MSQKHTFTDLDPKVLVPNPWNPNKVDLVNQTKIENSLKEFGAFKPIIVRELEDGTLQIIGGEHRRDAAINLGMETVPVMILYGVDDERAKKLTLIDNGQYGENDPFLLKDLLESLETGLDLDTFMPVDEEEIQAMLTRSTAELDEFDVDAVDIETPEQEKAPDVEKTNIKTHQVLRFKVPVEDAPKIITLINNTKQNQGFTDSDELTNAGDALVYLLSKMVTE